MNISDPVEIITIGEILVEIMRPRAGQPLDRPGKFRGPFASGAPAIFAVAAARLGLKSGFIGTIGQDAFGRLLVTHLSKENVNIIGLQTKADYATGVAFVAYDERGNREFVFHIRHSAAGQLDPVALPNQIFDHVKWLHISGSTLAMNENSRVACQAAIDRTRKAGGRISFDPNLREDLMPLERFKKIMSPFLIQADLVLPTSDEAQKLTGEIDHDQITENLSLKPGAITVLKRGPGGCSIYYDSEVLNIPGFPVKEIDPTGAGDCFSAAFIAGLEAGWPLEQVGRFANIAGALAVTKLGPMEGASTRTEVERLYE